MKRSLLLFVPLCLTLAACGGGGSEDVACESAFWDGTVGSCLPTGWRVIEREELTERGIPEEVVVAFQAEKPFSGQFPTVTVTRESLPQAVTSAVYSEASMQSVTSLPGYELVDDREVTIGEEDVHFHVFDAQPRPEEPKVRFYQVSIAKENAGYTYTAAVPVTIDDEVEEQITLILENATLTEPQAEEEEE